MTKERTCATVLVQERPCAAMQVNESQSRWRDLRRWLPDIAQEARPRLRKRPERNVPLHARFRHRAEVHSPSPPNRMATAL
jgi:hypothetical protein